MLFFMLFHVIIASDRRKVIVSVLAGLRHA